MTDPASNPATLEQMSKLINQLGEALVDAMRSTNLNSRGVILASAASLYSFARTAQAIEGWTEAQFKEYVDFALERASTHTPDLTGLTGPMQ